MTDLLVFAAAYIAVACLICEAREAKRRRLKHRETADLIWDTIQHWDGDPIDCAEVHNGEEENQDLKICFGEEIK